MIRTAGMTKFIDDRLKVCWSCRKSFGPYGRIYCQRKRLPASTKPFVREIQKHYRQSSVAAIKFIREDTGFSLRDCMNILNYLRGHEYFEHDYLKMF